MENQDHVLATADIRYIKTKLTKTATIFFWIIVTLSLVIGIKISSYSGHSDGGKVINPNSPLYGQSYPAHDYTHIGWFGLDFYEDDQGWEFSYSDVYWKTTKGTYPKNIIIVVVLYVFLFALPVILKMLFKKWCINTSLVVTDSQIYGSYSSFIFKKNIRMPIEKVDNFTTVSSFMDKFCSGVTLGLCSASSIIKLHFVQNADEVIAVAMGRIEELKEKEKWARVGVQLDATSIKTNVSDNLRESNLGMNTESRTDTHFDEKLTDKKKTVIILPDKKKNEKSKIKKCPYCGHLIATSAEICPNCGGKNRKPVYKRIWFIILLMLLGIFIFSEWSYWAIWCLGIVVVYVAVYWLQKRNRNNIYNNVSGDQWAMGGMTYKAEMFEQDNEIENETEHNVNYCMKCGGKITVGQNFCHICGCKVIPQRHSTLLKRAFMFLEDGEWMEANKYCEKVLEHDPENAYAHLGKQMAEQQVHKLENLENCSFPFDNDKNHQKMMRFGDDVIVSRLSGYNDKGSIKEKVRKMSKKKKLILMGILCVVIIVSMGTLIGTEENENPYTYSSQINETSLDQKIETILYGHLSSSDDFMRWFDLERTNYSVDSIKKISNGTYDVKGSFYSYEKNSTERTRNFYFEMNVSLKGESFCKSVFTSGYY